MYSGSEVQRELVPLSTLHMMTSSHSLFLPTMLECDDEPGRCQAKGKSGVEQTGGIKHETKKKTLLFEHRLFYIVVFSEALVSLLLCLVRKCPTVCNINHFVVLLGAYGVTLSTSGKSGYLRTVARVCFLSSYILLLVCRSETLTASSGV